MGRYFIGALGLCLAISLAAACTKDPAADKAKAEVTPAQPEKKAPAAAEKLKITADTSKVGFVGAKVTAQHAGWFKDFSGEIDLVDNDPTKSRVTFDVKTASLALEETDNEKLDKHLRSPDFFDVEKYPTATFVSTTIAQGATEPGMNYTITGNLDIRGTKKSITFPAKIDVSATNVTVKSEFGINRKDFGIVYPGMPDDLIKENVLIKLDLNAKRATQPSS
jgi:polyisoprenoid-binding protein YceI